MRFLIIGAGFSGLVAAHRLCTAETNTTFIGRLATYSYYSMDQVTGMALAASEKLIKRFS